MEKNLLLPTHLLVPPSPYEGRVTEGVSLCACLLLGEPGKRSVSLSILGWGVFFHSSVPLGWGELQQPLSSAGRLSPHAAAVWTCASHLTSMSWLPHYLPGRIVLTPRVAERIKWYTTSCCCSVTKLYLTLCDPMKCSTPSFPVLNYLPEFAPIHVHWVSDTIQPSLPLSPHSPLALNLS